jgi:hypothetical protein
VRVRSTPRRALPAAAALATWAVGLVLFLLWEGSLDDGYEFTDLNRTVTLAAGLIFGIPTILMAVLLLVRRIARMAGLAAIAWMGFTAYAWMPVQPVLAVGAAVVAIVVLAGMVRDWWVQPGPTRSRPPGSAGQATSSRFAARSHHASRFDSPGCPVVYSH